jgi:hypothetical protein
VDSFTGRIDPSLLDNHLKIMLAVSGNMTSKSLPGGIRLPYYAAFADPTSPVYKNNDPARDIIQDRCSPTAAMLEYNENSSRPNNCPHSCCRLQASSSARLKIGLKAAATGYSDETSDVIYPEAPCQ